MFLFKNRFLICLHFFVVPSTGTSEWYQKGWVLALFGLAAALVLLILIGLCLRRFQGDMNVYVRERDPLPTRPKSKLGSQTGSRSSLYDMSERKFPFIGTPSPSRRVNLFCIFLHLKLSPYWQYPIYLSVRFWIVSSFSLCFLFVIFSLGRERDTLCKLLCSFTSLISPLPSLI